MECYHWKKTDLELQQRIVVMNYVILPSAGTDYTPLREEFVLTAASPSRQCVVLETLRDHAVEDTEIVEISLVNNSGISVLPSVHLNIFPARDRMIITIISYLYIV